MAYKNMIDLHMHTDNSFDGNYSAAAMCESAIANGLSAISFTDHFDVDFFKAHNLAARQENSYNDTCATKEKFKDNINLLVGIELGQPTYDEALTEKSLQKYSYDFVIGSIHNPRSQPDYGDFNYSEMEIDEVYRMLDNYFEEMLLLAKWNGFDTLAHLTYPLRYIMGNHGVKVELDRYSGIIDEILTTLVKNGKALEINTSGLRQKIGLTMPTVDYVRRFRELGGEYLTLGSDAHFTEHVGAGIKEGYDIALEAGFEYVTYFKDRKPVKVRIEK